MYFCVVLYIVCFVSFSVLFLCICVLYYCHRVATQLQVNMSYHMSFHMKGISLIEKGNYAIYNEIVFYLPVTVASRYQVNAWSEQHTNKSDWRKWRSGVDSKTNHGKVKRGKTVTYCQPNHKSETNVFMFNFNYALQPLRLIVRSGLDVPTFATRCLYACHHARAPSGGRWNCGREMSGNFAWMRISTLHLGIFYIS